MCTRMQAQHCTPNVNEIKPDASIVATVHADLTLGLGFQRRGDGNCADELWIQILDYRAHAPDREYWDGAALPRHGWPHPLPCQSGSPSRRSR